MKILSGDELKKVQGGFNASVALVVSAAIIFVAGILDGIVHPKSCKIEEGN